MPPESMPSVFNVPGCSNKIHFVAGEGGLISSHCVITTILDLESHMIYSVKVLAQIRRTTGRFMRSTEPVMEKPQGTYVT